jgi:uncharacterized protein involved in response to NO
MAMSISLQPDSAGAPRRPPSFALFNLGFRPFYLLAALLAVLSLPLWVAQYFGWLPALTQFPGIVWHAHEMVFGFAVAVITGFLFTAVRNWTGLPTPSGKPLAALALLWLLGRIAMLTGPGALAAAVDVAFLPAVAWCLWQPLHRSRNRNRFFVAILLALAGINAAFHLSHLGVLDLAPVTLVECALGFVVLIVAIMAGRVVPAFTRNAVRTARIRSVRGLDPASLLGIAATWIAWLAGVPEQVVAALAVFAAGANAARLWTWDPWATRARPILWILHLSYAWIPIGFLLLALALVGIAGSPALALHAFAAGAVGGMIIGMITRTARGHTGMPLAVGRAEVLAYVLVHLGAAARVLVPLCWPAWYPAALAASAVCWSLAFAIYCTVYWPLLSRARLDGKPG